MGTYDASAAKQYLAKPNNSAVFDGMLLIHKGKGLSEGHWQTSFGWASDAGTEDYVVLLPPQQKQQKEGHLTHFNQCP